MSCFLDSFFLSACKEDFILLEDFFFLLLRFLPFFLYIHFGMRTLWVSWGKILLPFFFLEYTILGQNPQHKEVGAGHIGESFIYPFLNVSDIFRNKTKLIYEEDLT